MVTRRPLVIQNGLVSELLQGDTVSTGGSSTEVIAGSGLVGGGVIGANTRLDFAVAVNPSGVIYVGDSIGNDGVSFVNATSALSSGNAALADSVDALASGNAALSIGAEALASGNAALGLVPTLGGGSNITVIEAASAVASGVPVGVDDTGRLQAAESYFKANEMDFGGAAKYSGTQAHQNSVNGNGTNCCVISGTNKAVFFQRIGTGYMNAVVGEWSGTSWTFGTFSTVYSVNCNSIVVSYNEDADRILAFFGQYSGSTGTSYAAFSVSGTTVTKVADNNISAVYPSYICNSYIPTIARSLITMDLSGGYAALYSMSGSTVTLEANSNPTSGTAVQHFYDQDSDLVIYYVYQNSGFTSQCSTLTLTASSITQNSLSSTFATRQSGAVTMSLAFVGNRKFVVLISDSGAGSDPFPIYSYIGTVNAAGTSITFGTEAVLTDDTGYWIKVAYSDQANRAFVFSASPSSGGTNDGRLSSYQEDSGSLTKLDESPYGLPKFNSRFNVTQFKLSDDFYACEYRNSIDSSYAYAAILSGVGTQVNTPTLNGQSNILGIADSTVASGTDCTVVLPGSIYNDPNASYTPGKFYYADVATSGLTVTSTQPSTWSGAVNWNYLGKAITTSGLLLINSL